MPAAPVAPVQPATGPSVGQPISRAGAQAPTGTSDATGLRLVCAAHRYQNDQWAAATAQVVTQRTQNVLVLPVEAVAGRQGTGQVDVLGPDGRRQTRSVLGLTDGKVVEIKSGLDGTETVAIPGQNLALPTADPGGEPGLPTGVK